MLLGGSRAASLFLYLKYLRPAGASRPSELSFNVLESGRLSPDADKRSLEGRLAPASNITDARNIRTFS